MTVIEPLRRAALWSGVVAFFIATGWQAVTTGSLTGLLGFSGFAVVGAVVLSSRPGNGVGWHLYGIGLLWTTSSLLTIAGGLPDDGEIPASSAFGPAWIETVVSGILAWPAWVMLPLIGLLFPTGRVETRMGRVIAWQLVVYALLAGVATSVQSGALPQTGRQNPWGVPAIDAVGGIITGTPGTLWFVALIIGVIVDLALRWRRATEVSRLQYRWLFFGLTVTILAVALAGTGNALAPDELWVEIWSGLSILAINLIPVSIGIAVTRHGLYEIGRVISRTVSYAIVTVAVVGVYVAVVASVTALLPDLPTVGVAIATLIAAALALPALRAVQRVVDRRFDRERYDAQALVEHYGERLRMGADPESNTRDLLDVVDRALRPTAIGLWTPQERP